MKKNTGIATDRTKLWIGRFAIVMGLVLIMTGMLRSTLGDLNYDNIQYLEQESPVYTISVDAGMTRDQTHRRK